MKWALAQLNKISMPYTFEESLDLSELIGFENIKTIDDVLIKTTIREYGEDTYQCNFVISLNMGLEDSVSLEIIDYKIETEATELYTTNQEIADATIIETNTLDTKEAIIAAILSEKPVSISNHDYVDDSVDDIEDSEEDKINPAFASLKDLL
ncbi:MAG: hypothetical protein IKP77_06740 [Acholeplasmatales bacterium]|nr:hypothetical protein [Acholeplasmatales bacterium]